jgi:hypothetical protein
MIEEVEITMPKEQEKLIIIKNTPEVSKTRIVF